MESEKARRRKLLPKHKRSYEHLKTFEFFSLRLAVYRLIFHNRKDILGDPSQPVLGVTFLGGLVLTTVKTN